MVAAMLNGSSDTIANLVEPGRVHRRVYADPDVFELEMERIFGRAWLFVGHTSQVPQPGDYFTTELGRQPVVMTRHRDGTVHVLFNRCSHRGAKVANERCGHAARLTCLYHGWSFDTDGTLAAVPMPEGCAEDFRREAFGLARVPRVAEYRGFVFASLAASGASFEDHIGPIKSNIDDLVDRAPDGALAFDLGVHRYAYDGNWKLQVENVLDSYHVPFGHASTVNKEGVQFARREGDKAGTQVIDQVLDKVVDKVAEADKSRTSQSWKGRRSYIVGNGHGWTSNTSLDDGKRSSPAFDEYKRVLIDKVGPERAQHILTPRLHNTLIYPNVSIMGLNIHVRVIKPVAFDRTEINVYPVRLVGAPDAMNFGNIRLLNVTHSAASFVQTDDIEAFVRTQKGLRSLASDWVDISRGLGVEEPDRELNATRASAMHEMAMRAQYKAWLGYMREAA
jgi:phenylpropionate dioxygenase-like ring-hydroxylating dioxygenase large terminal subunit